MLKIKEMLYAQKTDAKAADSLAELADDELLQVTGGAPDFDGSSGDSFLDGFAKARDNVLQPEGPVNLQNQGVDLLDPGELSTAYQPGEAPFMAMPESAADKK